MSEYRFRASFSILNAWARGDVEGAIGMYFGFDMPVSKAMIEGRKYHDRWQKETEKTGCLPEIFGGRKLYNPKCEQKYVIDLEGRLSWLTLVGVIDTETDEEVIEYKTGLTNSNQYANCEQIYLYGLMKYLQGDPKKKGIICHYNQYTKQVDISYVWFTKKNLMEVADWVENIASDIYQTFIREGYYEKYGDKKNKKYGKKPTNRNDLVKINKK